MNIKLKKIKKPEMKGMDMPSMSGPMFYVDDMQMSEIADWKVGEKYKMVVEVEMKSMSEDDHGMHGSLEVTAYKHLKEKTINEMSDKEFGDYQGQQLAKH